jgi:hypothetical protein
MTRGEVKTGGVCIIQLSKPLKRFEPLSHLIKDGESFPLDCGW